MANVRTRGTDKVKVVSAVITLAVIVALVFGIFSVAQNVKKSKNNNLVNLNETEGNVAIKTDDDPDIPVEEPSDKDDKIIYTMASGAGYGAAYMQSICIFMEMQWLDSSSIHTGEFFHGPFEVTDANRPFMIQISEGSTRELDERALTFLKTNAKRIEVLDAKELGLSTIDASVVDYFNHALFNNVYPIYNHALAVKREHPLTTRRYMWKVEY